MRTPSCLPRRETGKEMTVPPGRACRPHFFSPSSAASKAQLFFPKNCPFFRAKIATPYLYGLDRGCPTLPLKLFAKTRNYDQRVRHNTPASDQSNRTPNSELQAPHSEASTINSLPRQSEAAGVHHPPPGNLQLANLNHQPSADHQPSTPQPSTNHAPQQNLLSPSPDSRAP